VAKEQKSPVLEFELDAEDIITDRILLRQVIEKQEAMDKFIREHMENEEEKFEQIKRYMLIMAVGMVMTATGMDLSQIIQLAMTFL
jgi:hypothetical protein